MELHHFLELGNKELKIHNKVIREVQKTNALQKITMGDQAKEITNQEYIKYVLTNGTPVEKRDFLRCLEGQLYLKEGEVWLEDLKA